MLKCIVHYTVSLKLALDISDLECQPPPLQNHKFLALKTLAA